MKLNTELFFGFYVPPLSFTTWLDATMNTEIYLNALVKAGVNKEQSKISPGSLSFPENPKQVGRFVFFSEWKTHHYNVSPFCVHHFIYKSSIIWCLINRISSFPIIDFFLYLDVVCKHYVSSGIRFLKSISDALGPSIVCRKMKRTRLLRTEMDGRVRLLCTWAGFFWFVVWIRKYFSLFCIMNWHLSILVLRQWKGVTNRNESTKPSNDFPKVNNLS